MQKDKLRKRDDKFLQKEQEKFAKQMNKKIEIKNKLPNLEKEDTKKLDLPDEVQDERKMIYFGSKGDSELKDLSI